MKGQMLVVLASISSIILLFFPLFASPTEHMTLRDKISQMLITSPDKVGNREVGGIILPPVSNKSHEMELKITVWSLNSKYKIPPFISADVEGGDNDIFRNTHPTEPLYNKTPEEITAIAQKQIKNMKELGINMNLGPVTELSDNLYDKNYTFWNKKRIVSENPDKTIQLANIYIELMSENGIISVPKHFPGKTLSNGDPHGSIQRATVTVDDIRVFKSLNTSAIMISPVIVEGEISSNGRPSALSPEVISSLKKGFDGLVITDDLSMKSFNNTCDSAETYIQAIKSGNDIILDKMEYCNRTADFFVDRVEKAVNNGEITTEDIDNSVEKILAVKSNL